MAIYNLESIANCYAYGIINSSVTCALNDVAERLGIIEKKSILGKRKRRDRNYANTHQPLKVGNGAIVIFNGDCGFMERPIEDVIDALSRYNDMFEKKNVHIFFIRGGGEDPSWFNDGKILLSNIKCIEDYSLIITKHVNILCVGGGVSIDKTWKESKKETESSKDALPSYDENKLSQLVSSHYIHAVLTPTQPTFVSPYIDSITSSEWLKDKKNLIEMIWSSRLVSDRIYSYLACDCTSLPFIWLHQLSGNLMSRSSRINNIVFHPIQNSQIVNITSLIENNFCVNLNKIEKNTVLPKEVKKISWSTPWGETSSINFGTNEEVNDVAFGDLMDIALGGQEEGDEEEA